MYNENIANIDARVGTLDYNKSKTNTKKAPYLVLKRLLDILVSSISLVVLTPVFLIIAILIKIDSKGPVFFLHKRLGKNGETIRIYKFRSMVNNAEDLIKEFTDEQTKEFQLNFKLDNDPRITKIGNILRKTSLDELPQLINILKGDLSLVGPRPIVKDELEKYGMYAKKFLSATPGLTGYWAVNGRSNTTYEERVKMELFYINNISFRLDTKILFKTFSVVLKRDGAK